MGKSQHQLSCRRVGFKLTKSDGGMLYSDEVEKRRVVVFVGCEAFRSLVSIIYLTRASESLRGAKLLK
jgi:hypothetical protein